MTRQRLIVEMGMGVDLHGRDYTKAACRAVQDALRHSSMPVLRNIDFAPGDKHVRVTIGVADPGAVDKTAVAALLPHEGVEVIVTHGGMDVADDSYGEGHVIASAAVELFLPPQTGWRLR